MTASFDWTERCCRVLLALCLLGACTRTPAENVNEPEGEEAPAPRLPDIVLISLDTLRADHLGTYGYERETSPGLDAFAADATVFERCYSTAPWTLVSHMSLLTGLYPDQHRVVKPHNALSPANPILAERLSAAGYRTAGFYGGEWVDPRHGFGRGFDVYKRLKNVARTGEMLQEYLNQRDLEQPLFLFVHLFDIHSAPLHVDARLAYAPPPEYRDLFIEGAAERFEEGDAKRLYAGREEPDPGQLEALIALYDGGIRYVDEQVSGWLEDWSEEGWFDDSLVIVTSDHGESLGQRNGLLEGHGGLYREGLHIPLIVRRPGGQSAGERVERPVNQVDIVPTILSAARLEAEAFLPGNDLFGPGRTADEVMEARWNKDRAYIRWPQKIVQSFQPNREQYTVDLERDPLEQSLVPLESDPEAHAAELLELREAYAARLAALPLPDREPHIVSDGLDEAERERLRKLGYALELEDEPAEEPAEEPAAG